MLIVLGIAIATFLALIIGRLAWKLAIRIGARRVQRNVPVTVVDLQNDRDRLRAEQAILSRKIEVRLDEMKLRMAEQSAEVTRNRNRVETLMQQIADQDDVIAARDAEIARLSSLVSSLERELANTRVQSDDLQIALTAKDAEVAVIHEQFLAKLDEAKLPHNPLPITMDEATTRLTNRIKNLTNRTEAAAPPEAVSSPEQGVAPGRVIVKPAGTQQVQAKTKAKTSKKAPRVERQAATSVKADDEAPTTQETLASNVEQLPLPAAAPEAEAVTVIESAPAVGATEEPAKTGVTNVISLAQRIKALQREIAS